MHRRSVRFALLALLVTALAMAALFLQDIERRAGDRLAARNDVDARLAGLSEALAGIGTAQQSYLAPGQTDEPWFERMSVLVRQLYDDTAALQPRLRSETASEAIKALSDGTDALMGADTRARENLRLGQELMAADVIFSDSRNTLDMMSGRVGALRAAEHAATDSELASLTRERWIALGAVALVWLAGILALLPMATAATPVSASAAPMSAPLASMGDASDVTPLPTVDLGGAAALCTALSRLTSPAELPVLLGRASAILDASGSILWMGAGEELFAVTAHGYRPQMIARLGPIGRHAENATAAAWRTGEVTTVAGEAGSHGAIVAPMFGFDACVGVLAFEVRHGREHDPSTRAVAAMIAAQLASAVSAWPPASSQTPAAAPVDAGAGRARQAAGPPTREFRSAGI